MSLTGLIEIRGRWRRNEDMSMKQISRRGVLGLGGATLPLILAACGGAQTAEPARPTAASGTGSSASTGAAPTTASAPVPDREVVIAVSRDLANGPQDPFFAHSSPM